MLLLMLIPSMLTALSVVREKELGSIANFYAAPATAGEFLLGKQLPYVAVSLIQFATLVALAVFLFHVPIKGSFATLVLGGVIYVLASTGFGLLISVFASHPDGGDLRGGDHHHPAGGAVLRHVRAGLIADRAARGSRRKIFPSTYFQAISVGTFTKALGLRPCGPTSLRWRSSPSSTSALSVTLLTKQEN